ncbi:TadE family type IV pilus minor pilin [Actinopolyspora erythraea]|uniref:TadE family type IV pilus minor pilin n=1 Tax=Actinopolyspora erythraea TaxID=414996 RepID=UPI001C124CF8|nr:TadE family type IV pilus minor pilin [Actinopolyspora erythraea]
MEAALGICSVVAVFLLALGGVTAVFLQLRCTDAAIEAARLHARGDGARAERALERSAPQDARHRVTVANGHVTVTVSLRPLGGVLPLRLRARAHAVLEPGVAGSRTTSGSLAGVRDRGEGLPEGER